AAAAGDPPAQIAARIHRIRARATRSRPGAGHAGPAAVTAAGPAVLSLRGRVDRALQRGVAEDDPAQRIGAGRGSERAAGSDREARAQAKAAAPAGVGA